MGEENAIQRGRFQFRFAIQTPNQSAWPWIDVEIRLADREPTTTGRPELLSHYKSSACCTNEFNERHSILTNGTNESECIEWQSRKKSISSIPPFQILHGVYPEPKAEILRFTQGNKWRRVRDDKSRLFMNPSCNLIRQIRCHSCDSSLSSSCNLSSSNPK